MEQSDLYDLAGQLAAGFEGLQVEYEKLFGQYRQLQGKLSAAREQVSTDRRIQPASPSKDETSFSSRTAVLGLWKTFSLTLTTLPSYNYQSRSLIHGD